MQAAVIRRLGEGNERARSLKSTPTITTERRERI